VRYLGANKISLGFHHFWVGGPESEPVAIVPGMDYVVEILIDGKIGVVRIFLDGKSVLNHSSSVYPHSSAETYLGRNPVGGAAAGLLFSGQATLVADASK
jgi:hypothetical protein